MKKRISGNEHGFLAVWLMSSLLGLLILAGFAVDLGAWELHIYRIQHASDSAALAGAAKMPDVSAATLAATDILAKNGYTDGVNGVTATFTPLPPDRMQVVVKQSGVKPILATFVMSSGVDLERKSTAQYVQPVPLGSPFNILGSGNYGGPDTGNQFQGVIPVQNYWLSVDGLCTPKEDGDLLMPLYDANRGTGDHDCTGGTGVANTADPARNGYNFIVQMPVLPVHTVTLKAFDPEFAAGIAGSPDLLDQRAGEATSDIQTKFSVYDTNGSDDPSAQTLLSSTTFDAYQTNAINQWVTLYSPPDWTTNKKYRINVQVIGNPTHSYGHNAFALVAERTSEGNASASGYYYCDSRFASNCPRTYATGNLSILASVASGTINNGAVTLCTGCTEFFLGDIDPSFAGSKMTVSLWDPGEGASSMEIIAPDGTSVPFDWKEIPGSAAGSGVTSLDVSGTGVQPQANLKGTGLYNDRMIQLTIQIPNNYTAADLFGVPNTWWMVRYHVAAGVSDRTTWTVNLAGADPIHLVRNP